MASSPPTTTTKKVCRHEGSAKAVAMAVVGGALLGALGTAFAYTLHSLATRRSRSGGGGGSSAEFSIADQPERFARDRLAKNVRVLDIDKVFEPSLLSGKVILVTGANRGLGLALAQEASKCGASVIATCRTPSEELQAVPNCKIVEGIDVTNAKSMETLVAALQTPDADGNAVTVDVLINNAGYFMVEEETLPTLNFEEEKAGAIVVGKLGHGAAVAVAVVSAACSFATSVVRSPFVLFGRCGWSRTRAFPQ